jgi:hypothetical protein
VVYAGSVIEVRVRVSAALIGDNSECISLAVTFVVSLSLCG